MKRIQFMAALLLLPVGLLSGISIDSAYSRYYEDGEIRPISQYFGAKLIGQGFRSVIASQPDAPEGQYFITKLVDIGGESPVVARMAYLLSDSKKVLTHEWDLSGEPIRKWLYLGLTGSDWPGPGVQPLAWKIELLDASGNPLAEWKSFLWEMP